MKKRGNRMCMLLMSVTMICMAGCQNREKEEPKSVSEIKESGLIQKQKKEPNETEQKDNSTLPEEGAYQPDPECDRPIEKSAVLEMGETVLFEDKDTGKKLEYIVEKAVATKEYLGAAFGPVEKSSMENISIQTDDQGNVTQEGYAYLWVTVRIKNISASAIEDTPLGYEVYPLNEEYYIVPDIPLGEPLYANQPMPENGSKEELFEEIMPGEEKEWLIGYKMEERDLQQKLVFFIGGGTSPLSPLDNSRAVWLDSIENKLPSGE